ncbi:MAG: right-handed parallel beta-helix repeat-containing protein [Verrucomicrobiae bacterium]|nr:right-handed parallel beta-helix repeat-containing protein [Verrucomicrobiae bacterium]
MQALPFHDPFDYSEGNLYSVAAGVWDAGGSAGPEITVAQAAALTAPAGLASAAGKGVRWAPSGTARRAVVQFAPVTNADGNRVYVSFLLNIQTPPSSGSRLIAYLESSTSSTTSPQLGIFVDNTSRVGIGKKVTSPAVFSGSLSAGTHLVVVRYTFIASGNDQVDLWVDPPASTFGAGAPPVSLGSATGSSDPSTLGFFHIYTPSGAGPVLFIDEVRIGTNWADVTPPGALPPVSPARPRIAHCELAAGAMRLVVTNGTPGGVFRILSSPDLGRPLAQWEPVATNTLASNGAFEWYGQVSETDPSRFYAVEMLPTGTNVACTPVSILAEPQSQLVLLGQAARFEVLAHGTAPVSYQWYKAGAAIPGATNRVLEFATVTTNELGEYFAVVRNPCSTVTSQVAQLILGQPPTDGTYFVSPTGNDSNPGTEAAPFYSLSKAVALARPGDVIYMRGGTYLYTSTIVIDRPGAPTNRIKLFAYPGERPVLNFSNQPYGSANRGILITTNAWYWHIKGLEICYAGDNGMKIEGSHIRVEQCVFHHNGDSGLQIGFSHSFVNPGAMLAAFIEVINCDSYMNYDPDNRGSDADGFAAKMHCGQGIVFIGCRAWKNSDDGWDLFETDASVVISNCWTWHNGDASLYNVVGGSFQGNGNGFKLGGNGAGGNSKGTHYVYRCVSFNNNFPGRTRHGFDQNSHRGGIVMYHCLAWNNLYNYFFEDAPESGAPMIFKNNVSFGATANATGVTQFPAGTIQQNNSWNLSVIANAADYTDLTEAAAEAPRGPDGSLPTGFARLVAGSDLIDRGTDIGQPYLGTAPDLGPYEFGE